MRRNIQAFALCLFMSLITVVSSAQEITIKGKVTDLNNKPVKGASIFVDDAARGVKTNKNGVYELTAPTAAKVIRLKSKNGEMMEQQVNGRTEIDFEVPVSFTGVKQPEAPESPDEQVNVGYGTMSKKNLSSTVTKVDADQKIVYKDIYDMLRGRPGVQVSGKSVKIQGGVTSFNLSTEPLYVLDGVIVSYIDDINPLEVKSIEILKGSAAAIYGSRGANGVILITRKK
jgi:TonB-dependent SusC/RagA subfamily outer membrane receptor